jgi:diguanylate cyclase
MNSIELYKQIILPSQKAKYFIAFLIIILLFLGYGIVEATGGTRFAYLHVLYIPIILSGFVFSIRGGILAGIFAGFLLSPYMPSSSAYDLAQPLASWTLRMLFFTLVGSIAGVGSSLFKAYLQELELKQIMDPLTNLPNLNGLNQTFAELIENRNKGLIIIVVELFQKRDIEQALGTEGTKILLKEFSKDLKEVVGDRGKLGVIQPHQFAILVSEEDNIAEILNECETISQQPYLVRGIPLFVEMRFGISRYPYDDRDLDNLTRKALVAINLPKNQAERVSRFN